MLSSLALQGEAQMAATLASGPHQAQHGLNAEINMPLISLQSPPSPIS